MTNTLSAKPRDAGDGFEKQRISQSRGPTYQGDMRLVADYTTDANGQKPAWQELEIWETRSGKWVAVIMGRFANPDDTRNFTKATLFEDVRRDDLDFQIAVAKSLDWTSAARRMLREQLGWKMVVEVG